MSDSPLSPVAAAGIAVHPGEPDLPQLLPRFGRTPLLMPQGRAEGRTFLVDGQRLESGGDPAARLGVMERPAPVEPVNRRPRPRGVGGGDAQGTHGVPHTDETDGGSRA